MGQEESLQAAAAAAAGGQGIAAQQSVEERAAATMPAGEAAPSTSPVPAAAAPSAGAQGGCMPTESEILARLVQNLGQLPGHSVTIAEVQERLPPSLRAVVKSTDDICRWLRRFPGLLDVQGPPGQERVALTLGRLAGNNPATGPVNADAGQDGATLARPPAATGAAAVKAGSDEDAAIGPSSVQLRGLPFHATIADIRAFLGEHSNGLAAGSIQLLLNRDGRPSGFARVQLASPQAAQACREALHRKQMGDRYVEVLACSERAKGRQRRTTELVPDPSGSGGACDRASDIVEMERVLQECREHMCMPGRCQLLLSMLGIALSPASRAFLRRANLGLKHILIRSPHEFRIDGPKGCERVLWCGGLEAGVDVSTYGGAEAVMSPWVTGMPAGGCSPCTPKPATCGSVDTPSDWGTPGPGGTGKDSATLPVGPHHSPEHEAAAAVWASYGWPAWGQQWMPWGNECGGVMDGSARGFAGAAAVAAAGWGEKGAKKRSNRGDAVPTRSHAHLHPQSHPFANYQQSHPFANSAEPQAEAKSNVAVLRLRGLPFSVTVQDVLAFFAQHDVADRIADGHGAAQLLPKGNGRPSGQAVVQMRSRQDAEFACSRLSQQYIGGRYMEVFVYGGEDGPEGEQDGLSNQTVEAAGMPTTPASVGATSGVAPGAAHAAGASAPWPQSFASPWGALPPWAGIVPPPAVAGGPGGAVIGPGGAGMDPRASDEDMAALFGFLWQNPDKAAAAAAAAAAQQLAAGGLLPGATASKDSVAGGQAPTRTTLQV